MIGLRGPAHPLHPVARAVQMCGRWAVAIGLATAYAVVTFGPQQAAVDDVVSATKTTKSAVADGYVISDEAPHLVTCTEAEPLEARSAVVREGASISTYTMTAPGAFRAATDGYVWVIRWCAQEPPSDAASDTAGPPICTERRTWALARCGAAPSASAASSPYLERTIP